MPQSTQFTAVYELLSLLLFTHNWGTDGFDDSLGTSDERAEFREMVASGEVPRRIEQAKELAVVAGVNVHDSVLRLLCCRPTADGPLPEEKRKAASLEPQS